MTNTTSAPVRHSPPLRARGLRRAGQARARRRPAPAADPRRLGAGRRRPGRVRPPGRVRAVRRRLAGQRLGVRRGARAGPGALRRQRQLRDPGRRERPRRRRPSPGRRRPRSLAEATASSRPTRGSARSSQPQPGATLSADGHTAVLLAGADADTNEMVRVADDLKGPLQDLSDGGRRGATRPVPRCSGRTSTRPTSTRCSSPRWSPGR